MLHRLHGDSAVQSQRAGHHAAGNAPLLNGGGADSGGHLLGDVLYGGQNGHLGAVIAQSLGHRQGVLHDADLGLHVGRDIDGGVGDHHEAALVLEHTHLAYQTARTVRNQAGLAVQDGLGEAGGLQDALHGNVGLPFLHQLDSDLCGFQLLAVEVHDLVIDLVLAHLVEHVDDHVLLADQSAFHHALTLGMDDGAQRGLVMRIGQRDALFQILAQHIGFHFFESSKHVLFLRK